MNQSYPEPPITGEMRRVYQCDVCKAVYMGRGSLCYHMLMCQHTSNTDAKYLLQCASNSCKKFFMNAKEFDAHLGEHGF